MEISSSTVAAVLIGIFIFGLFVGAVLTHDYFYMSAENWCNKELIYYKTKSRFNNSLENSISWGIANGKS